MKKKLRIISIAVVFCVCVIFLFPAQIFGFSWLNAWLSSDLSEAGQAGIMGEYAVLNLSTSAPGADSTFTIELKNLINNIEVYYRYAFYIFKYDGSAAQLIEEPWAEPFPYTQYEEDGSTGTEINNWEKEIKLPLDQGHYIAALLAYGGKSGIFFDYKEFSINPPVKHTKKVNIAPAVETVWVRDHSLTCYQVWVNENDNFQFAFWYPYADNNWVKIYDANGSEVFSIDMPIDNPQFEVSLPDGTYIVKTFNIDQANPIETFNISK
jgi:hypothetical protein